MAGKRFILLHQLQSLLKPIPRASIAFFILYFNPTAFWIQQATAKEPFHSPSEPDPKSDWELVNVDDVTFRPPTLNSRESTTNEIAASGLVHEALELYQSGQFSIATRIWQKASDAYRVQGDKLNEAMALSHLALAYQQIAQARQARRAISKSLKLLQGVEHSPPNFQIIAQILNNQGSWQLASGQPEQALISMQKAVASYKAVGDRTGMTLAMLNSAGALQNLGFYRRAVTTLDSVAQNLHSAPDSPTKVVALRSLGNALRGVGDLPRARQILEQSLKQANSFGLPDEINAALISLGNVARLQSDKKAAWKFYQQAAGSKNQLTATEAKINSLSLLIENKSFNAAATLAQQIAPEIKDLPAKRAAIYASINFAQSLKKLRETAPNNSKIPNVLEIAQLLANSVQIAKSIEDFRAEAYALGSLGSLYEHTEQWSQAKKLTQQALVLAGALDSPDINYRFSWQLGRILKAQGDINGALASLTRSTNALKALRGDLVAVSPTLQFDFRDQVEPVYRELAGLLLLSNQPSQENLILARDAIEALQVAELNDFFRTACLETKPIQADNIVDKLDPEAAIVYPIVLPDRLEVIVKLPNLPLLHYRANVSQSNLENLIQHLQQNLTKPYPQQDTFLLSKQIYDWLLRPAVPYLTKSSIKTLVFVLDGSLRNIPMAALYDGQQYLVQKYAIALSPALNLLPTQPIERIKLKALTAGLTEARQGFSPLTNVAVEFGQIKSEMPSKILLNQQFTTTSLQQQIQSASFPIVHLATHAQFSSEADKTYILAWDKPIFVRELDTLLRSNNPQHGAIELLILSACSTAKGDNRAALGLAGVSVKAGARSTLATLWATYDDSSAVFMNEFYKQLTRNKLSKAEALRFAQLSLLNNPDYQLPIFWASYIMIGNWT